MACYYIGTPYREYYTCIWILHTIIKVSNPCVECLFSTTKSSNCYNFLQDYIEQNYKCYITADMQIKKASSKDCLEVSGV